MLQYIFDFFSMPSYAFGDLCGFVLIRSRTDNYDMYNTKITQRLKSLLNNDNGVNWEETIFLVVWDHGLFVVYI